MFTLSISESLFAKNIPCFPVSQSSFKYLHCCKLSGNKYKLLSTAQVLPNCISDLNAASALYGGERSFANSNRSLFGIPSRGQRDKIMRSWEPITSDYAEAELAASYNLLLCRSTVQYSAMQQHRGGTHRKNAATETEMQKTIWIAQMQSWFLKN